VQRNGHRDRDWESRAGTVAVTIAVAINTDGRREVLGTAIGASEAEIFWVDFVRRLKRRDLAGSS
jgi:transposase-like protein